MSSKVRKTEKGNFREEAYHTIKFVYVIFVIIIFVVIVIVVIFGEHVIFERLAGEVVDSTRYDLQTSIEDENDRKVREDQIERTFSLMSSPI